jgi:hypothetical protein
MPRVLKPDVTPIRVGGDQPVASEEEGTTLAAKRCGDRRGITGFIFRGFPEEFTGAFVQGHDARAICSPNVQKDGIAFYQRRAGHPEKAVGGLIVAFNINAPKLFPASKVKTMQDPLGAKGVKAPSVDARSRPRTIVEAELVLVTGWVAKAPDWAACPRIEAFNGLLILQPMEKDEPVVLDHWTAEPMADSFLPNH